MRMGKSIVEISATFLLGFRVMDIDFYDRLPNGELFKYDTRMSGLTLGFM
jgi:hypothetical protein